MQGFVKVHMEAEEFNKYLTGQVVKAYYETRPRRGYKVELFIPYASIVRVTEYYLEIRRWN